jgi:hypothetical protein
MSTATSLCFRIHQIWKAIAHQRVATLELANQLETLTRLSSDELNSAILNLKASEVCARSLFNPTLTGQQARDELGIRISLELKWGDELLPGKAELNGWLINPAGKTGPGTNGTQDGTTDTAMDRIVDLARENGEQP